MNACRCAIAWSVAAAIAMSLAAPRAQAETNVTCMLPGQIHNVGGHPSMGPRRPIQTTPSDCQQRGGEYTVPQESPAPAPALVSADANDKVRCQLPKQLRQLGSKKQYWTAARTVTTTRASCQARKGKVLSTVPSKHTVP